MNISLFLWVAIVEIISLLYISSPNMRGAYFLNIPITQTNLLRENSFRDCSSLCEIIVLHGIIVRVPVAVRVTSRDQ